MKTIELTQGKVTIVDDDDYEWLSQWTWCYGGRYAMRIYRNNGKCHNIGMHREILGTPDDMDTDHINMDKLDNRKTNLRICNSSQNHANRERHSNNTSGYKGISWHKGRQKWQAKIGVNYKTKNLGYFTNIEDAALAYKEAALKYFGEFARM